MEETKVKTLSEIYCLLNYFPKTYVDKIPSKLLELISYFSNSKYFIDIDTKRPLEEQNISKETKNMLIVFKYNYWSNEDEKQEIIKQLNENEYKYQEKLKDLFKNNSKTQNEIVDESTALVKIDEKNIFKKIIEKIKNIFKR